jgi:Clp amino terminal domain, pathogenicity island component
MRIIATLVHQAEGIARARGAATPGAEHLVLAAVQLPDGTARHALERLGSLGADFGAALDALEAEDLERIGIIAPTERITADLPEPSPQSGVYRSDPSAEQLFFAAGDDARRNGGTLLGAHVLRAAAALEHGRTARALRRMGIDGEALRTAADRRDRGCVDLIRAADLRARPPNR